MANDKDHKINETIENLAADLKPVQCMKHPLWVSLLWIVIAATYVGAAAMYVGVRPEFADKMIDQYYVFEMMLALITGIAATIVTFFLTIPDCRGREWILAVPVTLFAVQILWMVTRFAMEGMGPLPSGVFSYCWMDAALMAGLPAAIAIFLIKRGATVRPYWLMFNAILAIACFGWIGIRFTCPYDSVGKAYFINFLPFLAFGLILGVASKRLLKW